MPPLVGTLYIDIADVYFGTGLPISTSEDMYHVNCKLTLQIFEIKHKSEEIVHFYLTFLKFLMHF